jgi:hypothetical protein
MANAMFTPTNFEPRPGVRFYGVSFSNGSGFYPPAMIPHHPQNQNKIVPYVPSDNKTLITEFQEKISNQTSVDRDSPVSFLNNDVRTYIIIQMIPELNLKELKSVSEVSKCFYIATKADCIWEAVLKRLLPDVECMEKQDTRFTPEQQFQIIFRKIRDEQRPYVVQARINTQTVQALVTSGATAYKLMNANSIVDSHDHQLMLLAGSTYDGTPESIAPNSQLGRCNRAVECIQGGWNVQEKFEGYIKSIEPEKGSQ